mgnify:CR=1 FL=1
MSLRVKIVLLLAVLAPHRRTVASRANYNTEIGVPLSLLRLEPENEIAVLEMGMYELGDIRILAEVARPSIGVVGTRLSEGCGHDHHAAAGAGARRRRGGRGRVVEDGGDR